MELLKGLESLCLSDITKMGIFYVHYHPSLFTRVHWIIYFLPCLRDRSFITSQGGAVVLEGGYNFKTSPFLGGKFFSGKKHEGGQIL